VHACTNGDAAWTQARKKDNIRAINYLKSSMEVFDIGLYGGRHEASEARWYYGLFPSLLAQRTQGLFTSVRIVDITMSDTDFVFPFISNF
jgi:hypothetical protein